MDLGKFFPGCYALRNHLHLVKKPMTRPILSAWYFVLNVTCPSSQVGSCWVLLSCDHCPVFPRSSWVTLPERRLVRRTRTTSS